ncbi:TIGR02391 family protein [Gordonia sp. (in: high G+C Gram-positive bacteria)]|uniref:TIGR02391 family protein n=1 Tax=Gordonia sp. (in: high G+C Gram-positive bacteria) TaxID=84139 RepID=UPI003BB52180
MGDSPAPPRVAAVRRLTFDNLHPAVQAAAGDFFADGHHQAAVSEAFKSIDVRVRDLTGIERPAVDRMAQAFKPDGSVLDVSAHEGKSGEDEQEGFMYIFRGAMWASVTPVPKNSSSRVTPSRRLSTSGSQACYTAGSTLRKPSVGRPGDRRRDIGIGCVSRGVGRTGAVAEGATQGRCATFQR